MAWHGVLVDNEMLFVRSAEKEGPGNDSYVVILIGPFSSGKSDTNSGEQKIWPKSQRKYARGNVDAFKNNDQPF
jgi:hypothetical protein